MYIWDIRKIFFFFLLWCVSNHLKMAKHVIFHWSQQHCQELRPRCVSFIDRRALTKNMNFFAGENDGAGPELTVNINQPEHLPLSANWFGQAEPSSVTIRKYITCVLAGQHLQHISLIIAHVRVVPHYKCFFKSRRKYVFRWSSNFPKCLDRSSNTIGGL